MSMLPDPRVHSLGGTYPMFVTAPGPNGGYIAVPAGQHYHPSPIPYGYYPSPSLIGHVGHVLNDPQTPTHCPFCGSGDIFGRSDGVIECNFCQRGCVIMEQPLHSSQPGSPGPKPAADNPAPEVPETDPAELAAAPGFEPPEGPEDGSMSEKPTSGVPSQFTTSKGASLSTRDYVRHLAFKHARDVMRGR